MKNNFECQIAGCGDLTHLQMQKIKALGLQVLRVPIRTKGLSSEGDFLKCHTSVKKIVRKYGGKRLIGHTLKTYEDGTVETYHHSVWITPENKVVDICKANYDADELQKGYVLFIPRMIDQVPNEYENEKMHFDFMIKGKQFFLLRPFHKGPALIAKVVHKSQGKKLINKMFKFSLEPMMKTTKFLGAF